MKPDDIARTAETARLAKLHALRRRSVEPTKAQLDHLFEDIDRTQLDRQTGSPLFLFVLLALVIAIALATYFIIR